MIDSLLVSRGLRPTRRRSRLGLAALALGGECLLITLLSLWLFPAIWSVSRAVVDIDQSAGPDRGVNLTEVANNPSVMWGRTVTISARVQEVHSPRLMTIGNDAFFVGDTVLVAAPAGSPPWLEAMEDDTVIRVTGVVRKAEPETWIDLGIETAAVPSDYQGKAVLVAESVELNPPSEIRPGDKEFASDTDGYDIGITAYDLTHNGDAYLGQTVVVSGEVEDRFLTLHAFLLGDDRFLVISKEPQPELFVEATAYVTGQVRRFHLKEIEAELGVDLDDQLLAEFEGDVFLLARTVELVA
ncbi:MAG TPA: hypothetical protein VGR16_01235 [Thermomicrobiales bacterium]|nr:hypothetical protein [Thermomicrobiales bacterium]